MTDVEGTIATRAQAHGDYGHTARTAQDLKDHIKRGMAYGDLTADQRESLDMIATKIARIVNGNPYEADHWHDIAGYATLCEKKLPK